MVSCCLYVLLYPEGMFSWISSCSRPEIFPFPLCCLLDKPKYCFTGSWTSNCHLGHVWIGSWDWRWTCYWVTPSMTGPSNSATQTWFAVVTTPLALSWKSDWKLWSQDVSRCKLCCFISAVPGEAQVHFLISFLSDLVSLASQYPELRVDLDTRT